MRRASRARPGDRRASGDEYPRADGRYTHMQHAQPLLLSHWLLAHGEAYQRDAERLASAADRATSCPHGIRSTRGKRLSLDRKGSRRTWGFRESGPTAWMPSAIGISPWNIFRALDTWQCICLGLSEDVILFASPEFGFLRTTRRIFDRQQPDAAEEKSRRMGTDPRQDRASLWRSASRCSPPERVPVELSAGFTGR